MLKETESSPSPTQIPPGSNFPASGEIPGCRRGEAIKAEPPQPGASWHRGAAFVQSPCTFAHSIANAREEAKGHPEKPNTSQCLFLPSSGKVPLGLSGCQRAARSTSSGLINKDPLLVQTVASCKIPQRFGARNDPAPTRKDKTPQKHPPPPAPRGPGLTRVGARYCCRTHPPL